ncbi:replication protein C [Ruegeria sp. TrichCH4B]|nr:replication protein C [Ruegeria sp. TrichCH4B]
MAELYYLPPVDKWQILDALGAAAEEFDLNHRTLSVLRALITFLPGREITAELNSCIVFPSNRTLSERLHGMPESTLRRHLAKLVELGIVSRHDSANRKRFARRGTEAAYGFDLSPLAVHAAHIATTAQNVQINTQECQKLRDDIACLRRDLMEQGLPCDHELLQSSQRLLRRKLSKSQLVELHSLLTKHIKTSTHPASGTVKMSTNDSQNERHKQTESNTTFDSEENIAIDFHHRIPTHGEMDTVNSTIPSQDTSLGDVLNICSEYKNYFPDQPRSWGELHRLIGRLAPMIGIEAPVYWQAERSMGRKVAASAVLCILERLPLIHNPGGYLRQLCKRADRGLFSLTPMISALRRAKELSADNLQNDGAPIV